MAEDNFDVRSNYNKKSAFSEVIFGAKKQILEVELNEMQEIIARYREMIIQILGNGVNPLDIDTQSSELYNLDEDSYFHLTNCIITGKNGILFYVEDEKVLVTYESLEAISNDVCYFKVWEEDATFSSELTEYGNVNGNTIENNIMDSRSGVETTRRKVLKHELCIGSEMPADTDTVTYIKLGHFDISSGIPNFVFDNYGNIEALYKGCTSLIKEMQSSISKMQTNLDKCITSSVSMELDVDENGNLVVRYDDGE